MSLDPMRISDRILLIQLWCLKLQGTRILLPNMSTPAEAVQTARKAFASGVTRSYDFRMKQIKALLRMVEENEAKLVDAIVKDVRKPKFEAVGYEIESVKKALKNIISNLENWMKPQEPGKPKAFINDEVIIQPEPYGVVLIIGAWNYPILLTLDPFTGAIAAGNTVILKPSEIAPHSAKILADLIPKYLAPDCYQVVNGGIPETTKLLAERFDYIFYTGSSSVGKIVHQAASKFLTPVTLELGGKSPVYVDETADLDLTAARILFGRLANAGQSCIAPDYVLCRREIQSKLVAACKKVIDKWYGGNVKTNPDYGRIVNENHFRRVVKLLEGAKIAIGGAHDVSDLYIEPTILEDVQPTHPVMQEEIFGPILPLITIKDAREAVDFINEREKPLALYVFSTDKQVQDLFLKNTSSGNMVVNDSFIHISCDTFMFGGVGNSGMGGYHGKYSFDTFSHMKGTLIKKLNRLGEYANLARYPPFSEKKLNFITAAVKKRPSLPGLGCLSKFVIFGLGIGAAFLGQFLVMYMEKRK
ncbi:unnamed protein product [Phaedon cochleariae]|uniref:Aldehyde dehydrogenase n=1 Tax=Phaedon cochleariae TaxID=80249 RepID=A0A9P0DFE2_PHACE|nr:unnamed protein product [Phaedon cochleariae]